MLDFYPRPPRGGRPAARAEYIARMEFLSTPSARRATANGWVSLTVRCDFYPRPPRGGRHSAEAAQNRAWQISIHALREEGDITIFTEREDKVAISIHALREEGDLASFNEIHKTKIFLSTPSARRATADVVKQRVNFLISIHALREEGDQTDTTLATTLANFYPRPPRGGRPIKALA